jgi:hypothetical protein
MTDFLNMARDPEHRRSFEKLLYLAARRGDADLVEERLSWGVDPNCASPRGTTALIANVLGCCPSVATVAALLKYGADANLMDQKGLTALDYARRKLARIQLRLVRRQRKSRSLDENGQLSLGAEEQAKLDRHRSENPDLSRDFYRLYWQERTRAARRKFSDLDQIKQVIAILEAPGQQMS